MSKSVIFMIESGKALEMIKQHIADADRVLQEVRAMAKELGVTEVYKDRMTGRMTGAKFSGQIHPDFTKPKSRSRPVSFPKKGTEWEKRLAGANGYRDPSVWISREFGIPTSIGYTTKDGGSGWTCIGTPLTECGFLYLSADGPYAMWVPDVPYYVSQYTEQGHIVNEPANSFKLEFDGCRRIEEEEWKILVLQSELKQKKAA